MGGEGRQHWKQRGQSEDGLGLGDRERRPEVRLQVRAGEEKGLTRQGGGGSGRTQDLACWGRGGRDSGEFWVFMTFDSQFNTFARKRFST